MNKKVEEELPEPASESKIRALGMIKRYTEKLYDYISTEVFSYFFTDGEVIERWESLNPKERVKFLPEFLEDLKDRWTSEIASQFCPEKLNNDIARSVIFRTIRQGVIKGDIEEEDRERERKYRMSVGSFLLGEEIVRDLGIANFVLYDENRRLYYPTQDGRELLAKVGGYASLEKSKGVHGLTKEERVGNASSAGKIGGALSYKKGVGIHQQTVEERKQIGRLGAIATGMKPWEEEETEYLKLLLKDPTKRYPEDHNHRGMPNCGQIASKLNTKYDMNRTPNAVRIKLYRMSKQYSP